MLYEVITIVDGQQRTLTLLLAVRAIIESRFEGLKRQDLKVLLGGLRPRIDAFVARQRFAIV